MTFLLQNIVYPTRRSPFHFTYPETKLYEYEQLNRTKMHHHVPDPNLSHILTAQFNKPANESSVFAHSADTWRDFSNIRTYII